DKIAEIYKSRKITHAEIEYQLLPAIIPGHESLKDSLNTLKNLDAICLVVRQFKNDAVYHIKETVDPERDINTILQELILADLMLVETRLERIKESEKKKKTELLEKEKSLLLKIKSHLENEQPVRDAAFSDEERKMLLPLQFITKKNVLIALNADETDINRKLPDNIARFDSRTTVTFPIAAKTEVEINALDAAEREEFLKELEINEPAINLMARLSVKLLNLITFFTAGENEARSWIISKGLSAPQTAGKIHTDIERGFIRAEIIKSKDLFEFGSEQAVKDAGKWALKGKDYIIEDSDIVLFRFNV
ncbi:MAG: redox-regulated ATPase YchF, partial [Candidatus Aureabacteria bacterium]|nr:redox-regulated ATPase YchF [Candidatus Auribacterota bacterium]